MADAVHSPAGARPRARSGSAAPAFELLESKLHGPRRHSRAVPRAELIDALEDASGAAPVVVLSAGPGWGKTTLLAQWAARSRRRFAWVSVDESDNDPIVLLSYVAGALDRLAPIDVGVLEALASPGVSVEGTLVPRLGAALARIDEPVVLALDDLHLLENPSCLDAIGTLAGHMPADSQMVLSARGAPVVPLGALRARGLALEVGASDLRMDEAAARQLRSSSGVDLPDEQLADLTERTEGWPAGRYLAALSIRARGVRAAGAATFSGSDRLVADYLQSELLAHVPSDVVRFLTRTAILEPMSGPLCDAVLEVTGSAAVLESRARANLFLVPLDAHRKWYRYHHLFRDLLRDELVRTEPELVPRLLARAADWCEAHGQPAAAIKYAQEAGDVERATWLFERHAFPAYHSGHVATAERWLDWLERNGALARNAAVAVLGALDATSQGRPAEAERWAEAAEHAGHEGALPDGSSSIDAWRAMLRAQRCQSGVAVMRADAELAVRTLARSSPLRPDALLSQAMSRWLTGEVDEADDLLADVVEEGLELGAEATAAVALDERAAVAIERGAWVQAEELADRALRIIRRLRLGEYPTSAFAYALGARVALHRGETKAARELLARSQRLRPRLTYAVPYFAVQTRLELARAYVAMADAGGAETVLREIEGLLRRQPDLGRLAAEVEALRVGLRTMRADAPGASTLSEAELRILPYLATHLSFREIGERRYVSRHTVKSHAVAVYRKLNVSSRSGAVERARELGLL